MKLEGWLISFARLIHTYLPSMRFSGSGEIPIVFVILEILWVLQDTTWINLSVGKSALSFIPLAYFLPKLSSLPCAINPLTQFSKFR